MSEFRRAIMAYKEGDAALLHRVERYLPSNYTAKLVVLIEGRDNAGWTMDDYVLPRLSSGMLFFNEVEV